MNKRKTIWFVSLSLVLFVVVGIYLSMNQTTPNDEAVLLTVNGDDLYLSALHSAAEEYPEKSEEQLIDGLILESLVLQKIDEYGIQISSDVVEDKLQDLKNNHKNLYDIAIEKYTSEALYKEALKYRLEYEAIKEEIVHEIEEHITLDDEIVLQDANRYIEEQGYEDITEEEMEAIKEAIVHNHKHTYALVHFQKWNYDLMTYAQVDYMEKQEPMVLAVDAPQYPMDFIELNYVMNRYGSFFNFNDVLNDFTIVEMQSTPIDETDFSHLLIILENKEDTDKSIAINFIIDLKNEQGLVNVPEVRNVTLNGYEGEMMVLNSESSGDVSSINLMLYDTDINGKYGFQSENCSEDELRAVAENMMRIIKISE